MGKFDTGILGADADHRFAPELGGLEHGGLVDIANFLSALLRGPERDVGDPSDLRFAVAHGIEALPRAGELAIGRITRPSRLAEIDVAVELANDQNVEPFCDLGLERRGADKLVV